MPTNYNQYQALQPITMYPVHGENGANAFPVAAVLLRRSAADAAQ